ncbi:hypothetical protein [Crassaminicella profunda]|uniref:hypothetical protein n=1 Tax=Crassaminicella profunda TaxID=1286698 RepID=UPI001CA6A0CB|nr:hypothetical protein [Crassaminicella profunda]QZY53636.1 hypothetical protein K7H06_11235 [Crassaminicella profunda]
MNELTPIDQNEAYVPVDELSMARFSLSNNKMFIFIIPLLVFAFFKNKNMTSTFTTENYEAPKSPPINTNTLDKMSNLLDNVKKAATLNDLKRNISQSGSILGKRNMGAIKKALNVFSESMDEDKKANMQKIVNVLSVAEKIKDVKSILNIQKAVKSENGDLSAQINNIIDVVAPMLPPEQAKNVGNFKKMAQMMKLMSAFEGTDDEEDEDHENIATNSTTDKSMDGNFGEEEIVEGNNILEDDINDTPEEE